MNALFWKHGNTDTWDAGSMPERKLSRSPLQSNISGPAAPVIYARVYLLTASYKHWHDAKAKTGTRNSSTIAPLYCASTEGRQVKHFLQTVQAMATSNPYIQKQASFDSDCAKQALSETLALSQKAIDQLNEARRVRPEQLNVPITL